MQFKVGDTVVHPSYGVGQIVEIEEKQLSAEAGPSLYYRGTFSAYPNTNVWTLVETDEGVGLRSVTTKRDLEQYRKTLKSRPVVKNDSSPQQHASLNRRLRQGSFKTMCEVARDLTIASWQKPLGTMDSAVLKKTLESLLQEWAVAAGISVDEATEEVKALLCKPSEQQAS